MSLTIYLNNKIISNPNIKFTSLLENKKLDILLEEDITAINVQKYIEILDNIKVKNFIKIKFSEKDLTNILKILLVVFFTILGVQFEG